MTQRTGYCGSGDLTLGDLPLPQWLTRDQAVASAADEMDSKLGFVYQVPIDTAGTTEKPVPAVVGLFLKRINATLASGRLILQLDVAGENERLHAYGLSLVQEANEALDQLMTGQIALDNVPSAGGDENPIVSGPMISNLDPESMVEAFYNRIANPYAPYPGRIADVERDVYWNGR